MTPGRYATYCEHGVYVSYDCWQCWQRRAWEAEAALKRCAEALRDAKCQWGDEYLWEKLIDDEVLADPTVRAILEGTCDQT